MKMNKVLLTHSYFYKFDRKQWRSQRYYPPLGTLYAASILRNAGADLVFHDTCLSNSSQEIQPMLKQQHPDLLVIYDDGFNYLTKMCLTNMREAAFEMIEMGKSSGCKVIVCSSDSTDHYSEYLEKGADFILLGEGEYSLKELYNNIFTEDFNPNEILGIAHKTEEKVIINKPRPVIKNLDDLPSPSWDLVDMDRYKNTWIKNHGYFSLNLATTRGCPYNCNWCAKPIYGKKYNTRTPENVVNEIEHLITTYGVSDFWFCDDIFGLEKDWVSDFRELVGRKKLKFNYTIQSRADLVIKDNVAEDLAASGAEIVWLGAESGSQEILDAMNKGQTIEEITKARYALSKNGIKAAFFIQFGYLGEKIEDIRKTINMVMDLMPDDIGISISYPLPGTLFHEQVKNELDVKANWSDSDDLALMYKGNFSNEYYRRLHGYLHKLFRRKQRISSLKSSFNKLSKWNKNTLRELISVIYYFPAIWIDKVILKNKGDI